MMSAMVRDGRIASNGGHQLQSEHTGWRGKRVDLVPTFFVAAHAKVTTAEVFDNVHPLNALYTFLSVSKSVLVSSQSQWAPLDVSSCQ